MEVAEEIMMQSEEEMRRRAAALRLPAGNRLDKAMKLRHKALVDSLFHKGRNCYSYPLRCLWLASTDAETEKLFRMGMPPRVARLQFLITVPKKRQRHAVDRVLLRRRIREAFRLQRHILYPLLERHPEIRCLRLAFIYISPTIEPYGKIARKMREIFEKILNVEWGN